MVLAEAWADDDDCIVPVSKLVQHTERQVPAAILPKTRNRRFGRDVALGRPGEAKGEETLC